MSSTSKNSGKNERKPLPSKEEIVEFITSSPGKVGKREIARAFHIKGSAKIGLKRLLREMSEEGMISHPRKRMHSPGKVPAVTIIEIFGRDRDGDYIARPVRWDEERDGQPPKILVIQGKAQQKQMRSPAGIGDRLLARISKRSDPDKEQRIFHQAVPIKKLEARDGEVPQLGVFMKLKDGKGRVVPVKRNSRYEYDVVAGETRQAEDGDLVRFQVMRKSRFGNHAAKVLECLGNPNDERQISLIAIHNHGIPDLFPPEVLEAAKTLEAPAEVPREDLRDLPLITIDPPDARDHDDAVWAGPDPDENNPGGHVVIVAIADVAAYVHSGSVLDREALKRGNSVYFPDRVVPMLPERLSNDLCSLIEGKDRYALAVRMVFDAKGQKRSHKFMRVVMRSHAKLSYEQAQKAIEGVADDKTAGLLEDVLKPLYAAWAALKSAQHERGPLALDLPERKIIMNDAGHIERIFVPERLEAHKLIEEFMIQANVAAAQTLEQKKARLVYRVHEPPSSEKLDALQKFLRSMEMDLSIADNARASNFNHILTRIEGTEYAELVNTVILRSQSQAIYSCDNRGHFGLHLKQYAHFTSPIRRYADLLIHRALITRLGLGDDGLGERELGEMAEIAQNISDLERRAMAAERETIDRLIAHHLGEKVGAVFQGRIAGVNRAGLFVRLDDTGADGFVPARSLGNEYYAYDEARHALIGMDSSDSYQLGDTVEVRLLEAVPAAGTLEFEMLTPGRQRKHLRASDISKGGRGGSGRGGGYGRSGRGGPKRGGKKTSPPKGVRRKKGGRKK